MSANLLTLVDSEDPVLRKVATLVTKPASAADLADDLLLTMKEQAGVGLAAPQVGRSLRLFVTGVDRPQVFVNPEITARSKELIVMEEGCLSLPRLLGDVERPKRISVKAVTPDGEALKFSADDLLARVIQHELDHLDGILFPDRMPDLTKLRTISQDEWDKRLFGDDALKQSEM